MWFSMTAVIFALALLCSMYVTSDAYAARDAERNAREDAKYAAALGPDATAEEIASLRRQFEMPVGQVDGQMFCVGLFLIGGLSLGLHWMEYVRRRDQDGPLDGTVG